MIHFVGAGSGAADLITVRGRKFLEEADVIIYAGSLVNPELLNYAKEACKIYDSAKMTLEEVLDVMRQAEKDGQTTVRLHTGDPCIYGAIREQMDVLDAENISYDYCPGVSSFCGAASALNMEYTLPGVSQSVIITRMAAVHRCRKRRDRFLCGTSGNDGNLFKHGYGRKIIQASDCRRLFGKYAGSDCL